MLPFVRFILLVSSGVLAGATVCVWFLEHSFAGSAAFFTELKQLEIRAFTVPLPAVGLIAVVFGLAHAALVRLNRSALALTLAGVLCLGIGAVITARGHFPMNDRIATWSPSSPPAEWIEVRDRWRQAHDVRTAVTVLGFGLFLLGTMRPERQP
ncbi:MAG: anthrone oxygenase family protein [Vicinamibacterales bacterium]